MTSEVVKNPPTPGSPSWKRLITASKVPSLLGISPYRSQFTLWHDMNGTIPAEGHVEGKPEWDWGHDAEPSLVKWWLRHHKGWQAGPGEIAYKDDDLPFPNMVTLDRRARRGRRFHILECKVARDIDTWGRPGEENSVPDHYRAQVITQMGVSGIHEASVIALGFGTPEIHTVDWDADLWAGIVAACVDWHASLKSGIAPDLDDRVSTYETVRGLHPDIDRERLAPVDPKIAGAYLAATRIEKEAARIAQGRKTRLLAAMGNARRAVVGDAIIATRSPSGRGAVKLTPNLKAMK